MSRRTHHRRRGRARDDEAVEMDTAAEWDEDAALAPEERAYREAQALAEAKLRLAKRAMKDGIVTALLLVFLTPVGVIVGAVCAVKLGRRYYELFIEPDLRRKWVDHEVERRVDVQVSGRRREIQQRQARDMEHLSASIAHEIRNPITAAKSLVQQMGEDPGRQEQVEYAKVALDELDRVERSISHLLRYAREEDLRLHDVRMRDIVESALESLRDRFESVGAEITCEIDADGQMRGDDEKLRRVVINLMGNALDALEQAGVAAPRIELALGENLAGSEVWVRVRDNGPGIDPERLHRIFSPFYTSKQNGTGLGLAISKKLVDAHGGSIEAHSSPGSGTEFVLTFPKRGNGAEGTA